MVPATLALVTMPIYEASVATSIKAATMIVMVFTSLTVTVAAISI